MTPSESNPDETVVTSTLSHDVRSGQRNQWIVIIVLSLAVVFVVYEQIDAKLGENAANSAAQDLAEPVDKLCRHDPNVRQQIGDDKCDQAAEVQRESTAPIIPEDGEDGEDGAKGDPGRGITNTAVVNGHLFVTYTDGVREDKGVIATDGDDGRGISNARLDETGQLVLTFTDGTSTTVGRIVGRDGERGRGVSNVVVSNDYRVIVTYTDGTVDDVGALPPGPAGPSGNAGPAGRGIDTINFDLATCTATIHYSDGKSETKTMTGCERNEPTTTTTTTTPSDGS